MNLQRPRMTRSLGVVLSALLAVVLGTGSLAPAVAHAQSSGTIRLTVQLTLRRATTAPSQAYVTSVLVRIYRAGGLTAAYSSTEQTDTSGAFAVDLTGLSSGAYDVEVKPYGALSRKRSGVSLTTGVTTALTFGTFTEGDADSVTVSNAVNLADANVVKTYFGKTCSTGEAITQCPDFNHDGKVTVLDLSAVGKNYNKAGPEAQS